MLIVSTISSILRSIRSKTFFVSPFLNGSAALRIASRSRKSLSRCAMPYAVSEYPKTACPIFSVLIFCNGFNESRKRTNDSSCADSSDNSFIESVTDATSAITCLSNDLRKSLSKRSLTRSMTRIRRSKRVVSVRTSAPPSM